MTVQGHSYDDNVGAPVNRNLIINGGMSVAQRGTSTASITTANYYTADRWTLNLTTLGTWTQSVENDAPTGTGHRKSLKMLCTTADASPAAGDFAAVMQVIEAQNLQHFAKGTSSAKQFALSFWTKANVTGTYTVYLLDTNSSRSTSKQYTITASATWEKKTLIFDADTTGAFLNDNSGGLQVVFGLGAGSTYTSGSTQTWGSIVNGALQPGQTNLAAATSNYWQVTGVQLEAGPVATPFEFEPFETTMRKCMRYFYRNAGGGAYSYIGNGIGNSATMSLVTVPLLVPLRYGTTTVGFSNLRIFEPAASAYAVTNVVVDHISPTFLSLQVTTSSGLTGTRPNFLQNSNNTAGYFEVNAEL